MISENIIKSISDHLRACYHAHHTSDAWALDMKPLIRSRAADLTTYELRIAFETYSKKKMHPAAQREQIIVTIEQHLKHFVVQNIDPRTGASLK
jgi:hypothetical protein